MSEALYRHKKTGGIYNLVDHAIMQCQDNILDDCSVIIYKNMNGDYFVRPKSEFFDGRFEELK